MDRERDEGGEILEAGDQTDKKLRLEYDASNDDTRVVIYQRKSIVSRENVKERQYCCMLDCAFRNLIDRSYTPRTHPCCERELCAW
jgi:hypothetical protein